MSSNLTVSAILDYIMNIFYLDKDHETNARYHFDTHVVKMVTEYAQLLSSAVRLSGIDAGYKLTHQNHPCAVWVRESLDNWNWLRDLSFHLNEEFKFRYGHTKDHKAYEMTKSLPDPNIESIGLTKFRLAMPDDCLMDDPVEAYRSYYIKHKQHIASWKKREVPEWWKI